MSGWLEKDEKQAPMTTLIKIHRQLTFALGQLFLLFQDENARPL